MYQALTLTHDTETETFISASLSIIVYIGKYLQRINHFFHRAIFEYPTQTVSAQLETVSSSSSQRYVSRDVVRILRDVINKIAAVIIILRPSLA